MRGDEEIFTVSRLEVNLEERLNLSNAKVNYPLDHCCQN